MATTYNFPEAMLSWFQCMIVNSSHVDAHSWECIACPSFQRVGLARTSQARQALINHVAASH